MRTVFPQTDAFLNTRSHNHVDGCAPRTGTLAVFRANVGVGRQGKGTPLFHLKIIALAISALAVVVSNPATAADPQVYSVLNKDDYRRITGCDGYGSKEALTSAVQFLVFADSQTINANNRSIHYARRHLRPLLDQLLASNKTSEGALDPRCLPPSLRQMALALKMLNENGRYTHHGELGINDTYSVEAARNGKPSPAAYPVMNRMSFISQTGCKVTPASYDNLRLAFEELVIWQQDRESAEPYIIAFLEDLFDSRPTPEGYVDQRCMIDVVGRIASELGVLDDNQRYKTRR